MSYYVEWLKKLVVYAKQVLRNICLHVPVWRKASCCMHFDGMICAEVTSERGEGESRFSYAGAIGLVFQCTRQRLVDAYRKNFNCSLWIVAYAGRLFLTAAHGVALVVIKKLPAEWSAGSFYTLL